LQRVGGGEASVSQYSILFCFTLKFFALLIMQLFHLKLYNSGHEMM